MAHRADIEFFTEKKNWSVRKDRILSRYLAAYLPKVNRGVGKPILLVDGFAGAGKFEDGTRGSPMLMLHAIVKANPSHGAKVLAIEKEEVLHARLSALFSASSIVDTRHASFLESVEAIKKQAIGKSLFLYLDPYAVRGMDLSQLRPLFELARKGHSVEVLINFNAPIFVRWGLAAMNRSTSIGTPTDEIPRRPELDELDAIVGGTWWREVLRTCDNFLEQVEQIVNGYCSQLRQVYDEVCSHAVFSKTSHRVPKYFLVFASRHPDALVLMNDEMVKSARDLIEEEAAGQIDLFDTSLTGTSANKRQLRECLQICADQPKRRGDLFYEVVRRKFGQYLRKEIRAEIESCLKDGLMESSTGKVRINDRVDVWWVPDLASP